MKRYLALTMAILLLFIFSGCSGNKQDKAGNGGNNLKKWNNNNIDEMEFEAGDTFEIDNLKFTVNGVKISEGDEEWNVPSEGNRFAYIDITIENIGDKDETISSIMIFDLYDMEGYSYNIAFVTDAKGRLDGDLAPGKKMSGEIVYQVPKEVNEFELLVKPDFLGKKQAYVKITAE